MSGMGRGEGRMYGAVQVSKVFSTHQESGGRVEGVRDGMGRGVVGRQGGGVDEEGAAQTRVGDAFPSSLRESKVNCVSTRKKCALLPVFAAEWTGWK